LGVTFEASARARQVSQVHCAVDGDEHIGIFRHRLGRRQRTHKCDTQHSPTIARSLHEGSDGKKKRSARLGNRGRGTVRSVAMHLAEWWQLDSKWFGAAQPSAMSA
jgi:hypothetical protein